MYSLAANLTGTMTVTITSSGKTGVTAQLTVYDANGNVLVAGSGTNKHKKRLRLL